MAARPDSSQAGVRRWRRCARPACAKAAAAALTAAALGLTVGCASYGLHGSSRVLGAGDDQVAVTLDLVRFFARGAPDQRDAAALDTFLLLPGLQYRRGMGRRLELELNAFPAGLRANLRAQFAGGVGPGERGAAATAGLGCALAVAYVGGAHDGHYGPLLLPDASLAFGWKPSPGSEVYAALRYLWLREQIAGSSFLHAPGVTLGYRGEAAHVVGNAEAGLLVSPTRGDVAVIPGVGFGFR